MAEQMPIGIHRHYELKPSQIALGFRLSCLVLILYCSLQLLSATALILLSIVLLISALHFLKKPQVRVLSQLEGDEWSVQFRHQKSIQRVKIKKLLDHQLYIVVYFYNNQAAPLLIWPDQMDRKSWKSLVVRCKLSKS
ncbi:hypothetical protein EC844_10194 [Acinetobacter calcoaceticus]|uniref:Uncharacterized protein n=1 Tax=Acinetobacter calcoaceticus TaxID=471 RepID=A0A4R1Y569_ACICA|nr:hypothetical protein EC844_10194 [Acinetobacter calcoaceticus]